MQQPSPLQPRRPIVSLVLAVGVSTLTLCGQPAKPAAKEPELLFQDDFSADASRWRPLKGTWQADSGAFVSTAPGHAVADVPDWDDMAVEVRLRTTKPGKDSWCTGGFMFRFREQGNRYGGDYYYVLLHRQKNLELGKRIGGKQVKGGLAHARDVPPGTAWNTVRAEIRGGAIRVYVNDELHIECSDPETLPKGKVGLMNLGALECRFDTVTVTRPGPIHREIHPDWPGRDVDLTTDGPEPPPGTWPTFRCDNRRSGITPETLPPALHLHWTFTPRHAPRPAWPEPGKELHRMPFDYAPQVAIGHNLAFFGSSADHKVYALELETGHERWAFFTEGPIRFAPVLGKDHLFVASDDGCLYCLSASTGEQHWRFRAGPRDERFLGNGQMISRWPARAGVLVEGNVVYVTAGMWSTDGVFVHALKATDGTPIWQNDTCGQLYMKLPHDYLEGIAGVSPQGHMLLARDTLTIPNGRAMPATFDRHTGELLRCWNASTKLHHQGGSWNTAVGDLLIGERHPLHMDRHVNIGESDPVPGDGLIAWKYDTGEQTMAIAGKHRAVVQDGILYASGGGTLTAAELNGLLEKAGAIYATGRADPDLPRKHVHPMGWVRGTQFPWYQSKVNPIAATPALWETKIGRTYELILAGNTLVAGGRGTVTTFDATSGKQLWQASVDGQARGLATADSRLIVSTSTGQILCFGAKRSAPPKAVRQATAQNAPLPPLAPPMLAATQAAGAGYCLVLGAGDGNLVQRLARDTDLSVICAEPDAAKVAKTRAMLDEAGLYGSRAVVHNIPFSPLPYADYFATLVVADATVSGLVTEASLRELYRVLRPYNGMARITSQSPATETKRMLAAAGIPASEIRVGNGEVRITRGPLPGAGEWTHAYADPGRSSASLDTRVRLPLKMLWFGGPGPARIVSRHWRTPTPLFANGILFIPGEQHLIGVDAYTGRELWSRELENVGRYPARFRGASIVADSAHVYATTGSKCHQLDPNTGKTVQIFTPPGKALGLEVADNPMDRARGGRSPATPVPNKPTWEYLAVADGILVGTIGAPNLSMSWWPEAFPEAPHLFAINTSDGKPAWTYSARRSVAPDAVAISNGRIHLIDRTGKAQSERAKRKGQPVRAPSELVALDLQTGSELWRHRIPASFPLLWCASDILLAGNGRELQAYAAANGTEIWRLKTRAGLPVIIGDRVYVFPHVYELTTGETIAASHPLTDEPVAWQMAFKGGCGALSGCPGGMFFRSGASGMVDLADDGGNQWLGQVRPSCWINMIPAGGMLLCPEGASNCSCPYNYQTSIAMVPDSRNESWSIFAERKAAEGTPIRKLALNFGAVGDRRDAEGNLWLAFPRPFRSGAQRVPALAHHPLGTYRANADRPEFSAISAAWLHASGCEGNQRIEIDLSLLQPAVALLAKAVPVIDGTLNDPCWDGQEKLVFTTDDQVVDQHTVAFLRRDAEHLYLGYRRTLPKRNGSEPATWTVRTKGKDARVWEDDSLNIRLKKAARREGLYLSVSASGATLDGHSTGKIGTAKSWDGQWQSAVTTSLDRWSAEIAVPWETLASVGITPESLELYLENTNKTGVGPARSQFKYRPYTRLWCFAHPFARLSLAPPSSPPERLFRVSLHFREPAAAVPGSRVFDVKLQGQTVIEALDLADATGGNQTPLVRHIDNVKATNTLTLELITRRGLPPVINGLEIVEMR